MTETTAPTPTSPKVKKPSHPVYSEMIKQAITNLGDKSGSSRQAIVKYILKNFKLAANDKAVTLQTKMALGRGVVTGLLKQSKGTGASGSFKIGSAKEEKKPKAKKSTKTKLKKPKSPPKPAKKSASKTKKVKKPKAAKLRKPKSSKKVTAKKVAKPKNVKTSKKPAAKK